MAWASSRSRPRFWRRQDSHRGGWRPASKGGQPPAPLNSGCQPSPALLVGATSQWGTPAAVPDGHRRPALSPRDTCTLAPSGAGFCGVTDAGLAYEPPAGPPVRSFRGSEMGEETPTGPRDGQPPKHSPRRSVHAGCWLPGGCGGLPARSRPRDPSRQGPESPAGSESLPHVPPLGIPHRTHKWRYPRI